MIYLVHTWIGVRTRLGLPFNDSPLLQHLPQAVSGDQVKRFLEVNKTAMELALGMSCLLHQRADDENLISCAEILPETSLALGSAIPVLSPCCCPGFKHHGK